MKVESRGTRGERLALRPGKGHNAAMKSFPWKNPFKGGNNIAMAEMRINSAGMAVGFRVKF